MKMRCFCCARDYDGTYYAIFQTADGRMCRADFDDWNGTYSWLYGSVVSIDCGFVCDSRDFDRIRIWFDSVQECINYLNGYKIRT